MGARLHWVGSHDWSALAAQTDRVADDLARRGRTPYRIQVGGSVPLGSAAFVADHVGPQTWPA